MKIIKARDIAVILFALLIASGVAGHVFLKDLDHGEPFTEIIIKAAINIVIIFSFIMLAYISGGRRFYKGDIKVSPWFGAFVGGSPLVFFAGAVYWSDLYRGGFMALAIWGVCLLCLWRINSLIKKHTTNDSEHSDQKRYMKNAQQKNRGDRE